MGYVIGAILLIWLLFHVGRALLLVGAEISNGVGQSYGSIEKFIISLLGRKGLGSQPNIPKEYSGNTSPFPKVDAEEQQLKAYKPVAAITVTAREFKFACEYDTLFNSESSPEIQIAIESVDEILRPQQEATYQRHFNSLKAKSNYPVPPPIKPAFPSPPPTWTPWEIEVKEISFSPPYYNDKRRFLNRFVNAAHTEEFNQVNSAIEKRDALIRVCSERNERLSVLAKQAKDQYEMALKASQDGYDFAISKYEAIKNEYLKQYSLEQSKFQEKLSQINEPGPSGLVARIDAVLRTADFPKFVPREYQTRYDEESRILIHEHRFPDLSSAEFVKEVERKLGKANKAANQKEKKECALKLYPALCLRLAAEIAYADTNKLVAAVAINGWAEFTVKSTGQRKRAYCACLFATKEQISALNISAVDAVSAFGALKGVRARSLEITPIAPTICLDRSDSRFVEAKDVLTNIPETENIAAMDWEDFEHLCRQLFEKAFADSGAEVKVTQASRDQGVDAIIFDPDPLRGGKIVVQAKRYTNTVDVSAVRDLYGTVHNEGAIKGILVTTSQFGPDSYQFAKDKPLTLLDGAQLLGLLEQYGYKFRIDLVEAKRLAKL